MNITIHDLKPNFEISQIQFCNEINVHDNIPRSVIHLNSLIPTPCRYVRKERCCTYTMQMKVKAPTKLQKSIQVRHVLVQWVQVCREPKDKSKAVNVILWILPLHL